MEFHTLLLGEVDEIDEKHPLIASQEIVLPFTQDDNQDFPILFYGTEDGKLTCQCSSFPDILSFGDKRIPFAWGGNLKTLPAYRRQGLAQAIIERQIHEFGRRSIVRGSVFSAPATLRLFDKLSFTMLGFCPRLCLIRQTAPILQYHIPKAAAKILGACGQTGVKAFDRANRIRQPYRSQTHLKETSVEEFEAVSKEHFNPFTPKAQWDTSPGWVLRRQRVRDIDRIFFVFAVGELDPIGYVLIRKRTNRRRPIREKYFGINIMTLVHYGVFKQEPRASEVLVSASIDWFWKSDADMFEIITSCPEINSAARRAGMIALGQGMSFKFIEPKALRGKLPTNILDYKLTHYVGDAFAFE